MNQSISVTIMLSLQMANAMPLLHGHIPCDHPAPCYNVQMKFGLKALGQPRGFVCLLLWLLIFVDHLSAQVAGLSSSSYQVNVNSAGQNIPGDAANEPSLCIDPNNPSHIAVGWRQFDNVQSDFRQAGWAYSTNGGMTWSFPGVLEPGTFRSDPVLASDANGTFYYLGVITNGNLHCDLFHSTNGGVSWESLGLAEGGDKEWMAIDTTTGPGRGNIYQTWSPFYNFANNGNQIFSRSSDGGKTWAGASGIPNHPYFGTLAVGPLGELYMVGWDGSAFRVSRSTNAANSTSLTSFELSTLVDLGGSLIFDGPVNPVGLLGQPWVAVDRSQGPTSGNVYVLSTVSGLGNPSNVMFSRSTNNGASWSPPLRLNDDSANGNAYHWFGTLSVAPNGRIDACWNDTRHSSPANNLSELFYSYSQDGGLTWVTNTAISPPFDHTLGYPVQEKMGDYIGMISLEGGVFIAYTATFNGEEDIWFARVQLPIEVNITLTNQVVELAWNTLPGRTYCVEAKGDVTQPWSAAANLGCIVGTGGPARWADLSTTNGLSRIYRVIAQPEL